MRARVPKVEPQVKQAGINFPGSVDRVMTISCPPTIEGVNQRLQTSAPGDLVDWLSNRTAESTAALADAPKANVQAVTASLKGLQADNLYPNFRILNIPALFVYGETDPAISVPEESAVTSTLIHQIVLETSGHFPMLDESVKFNRLLTDFLALESGASPSELQLKEEWKRRVR